jgi:hypothetical protein
MISGCTTLGLPLKSKLCPGVTDIPTATGAEARREAWREWTKAGLRSLRRGPFGSRNPRIKRKCSLNFMTEPKRCDGKQIEALIDGVKALRRAQAERAASERRVRLFHDLGRFWPELQRLVSFRDEFVRRTAPRFNLFRLFGTQNERIHTAILAELLDPMGSHGQETLFLDRFLGAIGRPDLSGDPSKPSALVSVSTEKPITIGLNQRRLDIVIRCAPSFVVVIENKIRQGEGTDQLKDYKDWLVHQLPKEENRKVLVFLTIHGEKSKSLEDGYTRISYLPKIANWLADCREQVRAPRVVEAIDQYREAVEGLRLLKEVPNDDDLSRGPRDSRFPGQA